MPENKLSLGTDDKDCPQETALVAGRGNAVSDPSCACSRLADCDCSSTGAEKHPEGP